jgi:hypothetical protein
MKLIGRPHFLITWLFIKHRENFTLMNVNICISVSRKTDEQKHRVVRRRLGSNGAALYDRCRMFGGFSGGIAT